MEEYIDHPLYGLRILHYSAPVKTSSTGLFLHESCSNFKVLKKTIKFLPMCHHYVTIPKINTLVNESNITYLAIDYTRNAILNRSMMDVKGFRALLDLKRRDFDFIFNHQPELMYNIMVSLTDKRYGEIVNLFLFFHWVDNPRSRGSSQIPPGFMRQLEGINMANTSFFHISSAPDNFVKNIKKNSIININMENVKNKVELMPLEGTTYNGIETKAFSYVDGLISSGQLGQKISNKKILVFNHRWNKSTGFEMMEEYTKELIESGEYLIWCTDVTAPKEYVAKNLDFGQYKYLIENSIASMCFIHRYATWNLSVQDGIRLKKPVLMYRHSTIEEVVGKDYPFFFKSKEEFLDKLKTLPEHFNWKLQNFEQIFEDNLHRAMKKVFSKKINDSKYGRKWIKLILAGYGTKRAIIENSGRHFVTHKKAMSENSSWQWTRRWLLQQGVKDNPNSIEPSYFIKDGERDKFEKMVKDLEPIGINTSSEKEYQPQKNPKEFFNI